MAPQNYGRYEVQAEIGDGAMGRVYQGFDPLARRAVAIKTIKEELLSKDSKGEYVRRFQREAQAAGRLAHPNIVTIYDVGENYFVMEFLEGETLQALMHARGRMGLGAVVDLLEPVADAIDYAHRNGIIHRDIKPANIMVTAGDRPKLMDFGVVHLESTAMTSAGQFIGSPHYMSPEQISSSEITSKSDLFSLATVAYEMLAGRRPFEGANVPAIVYQVIHEVPSPIRVWNPELPTYCDDVFQKALAKSPAIRYPTAAAFISALRAKSLDDEIGTLLAGVAPAPTMPAEPSATPPPPPSLAPPPAPTADPAASLLSAPVPSFDANLRKLGRQVRPAFLIALVVVTGVSGWLMGRRSAQPPAAVAVAPAATPETPARVAPTEAAPAAPGPLAVESEPVGAAVFVDDQERGQTPVAIEGLAAGDHVVRVTRDGFASGQLNITLTAEAHPPLRFVLEPVTAALHVSSKPEGGTVSVDGRSLGTTPLEGVALFPGPHEVVVTRAGYRPWKNSLEATAGKPIELAAELDKVPEKAKPKKAPAPTPPPAPRPAQEGQLVAQGPGVTPPRKISGKSAFYPAGALERKLQGTVTVELTVTEKGEPADLKVVHSVGEPLDSAVLDAMKTWRYEPAVKDGVRVRVHIRESQRFEVRSPK